MVPRWSHGADFARQTRDQRGTTALVLVPRLVPWKRRVWSHRNGLVVPQQRPDGATPARPVAPQWVPPHRSPIGLAVAVQTRPHDAQDSAGEQDGEGHIGADEGGGESGQDTAVDA